MYPGTLIAGKYRVVRLLGEGAMGVVWAAVNLRTEREVALKLINGETDALRRRLLREARACGRLAHRNIIEILDVGETEEGEPFLVMPLLSGETLADRLRQDGLLPPPLAARIAADIARGLAAAHDAAIVHRDLKPANVFLHHEPGSDEDFVVKVLDFGVSKMAGPNDGAATMTGGAVGSPLYMSPEQAIGDASVGPRADLWSLGVLLFEMLTGTRPFYASSAFAVVAKILRGPIPTVLERAPGVDPALGAIVARCLVRRPADRLGSAAELAALLEPFAGAREHPAPLPPLPEPSDEEEPTNFFRRPRHVAADEMMAAAEILSRPEPLSSAEILASSDVLSSADVMESGDPGPSLEGTAPLPLFEPRAVPLPPAAEGLPAAEGPPSSVDPGSSTTPLLEGDEDLEHWARDRRRTGVWLILAGLVALAIAIGLYASSTPARHGGPAGSGAPARSAASVSAGPQAPSAIAVPPTLPPPLAASAQGEPPRPPPAPGDPPKLPPPTVTAPRTAGKIIRETPF